MPPRLSRRVDIVLELLFAGSRNRGRLRALLDPISHSWHPGLRPGNPTPSGSRATSRAPRGWSCSTSCEPSIVSACSTEWGTFRRPSWPVCRAWRARGSRREPASAARAQADAKYPTSTARASSRPVRSGPACRCTGGDPRAAGHRSDRQVPRSRPPAVRIREPVPGARPVAPAALLPVPGSRELVPGVQEPVLGCQEPVPRSRQPVLRLGRATPRARPAATRSRRAPSDAPQPFTEIPRPAHRSRRAGHGSRQVDAGLRSTDAMSRRAMVTAGAAELRRGWSGRPRGARRPVYVSATSNGPRERVTGRCPATEAPPCFSRCFRARWRR